MAEYRKRCEHLQCGKLFTTGRRDTRFCPGRSCRVNWHRTKKVMKRFNVLQHGGELPQGWNWCTGGELERTKEALLAVASGKRRVEGEEVDIECWELFAGEIRELCNILEVEIDVRGFEVQPNSLDVYFHRDRKLLEHFWSVQDDPHMGWVPQATTLGMIKEKTEVAIDKDVAATREWMERGRGRGECPG